MKYVHLTVTSESPCLRGCSNAGPQNACCGWYSESARTAEIVFNTDQCTHGRCIQAQLLTLTPEELQQCWWVTLWGGVGRVVPAYGMLVARALVTPTRTACLPPEVELSNRVVRHFRCALLPVLAGSGGTASDASCISTVHACLPCSQQWHVGSCGACRPSFCASAVSIMFNSPCKTVGKSRWDTVPSA